jgi:hypothetical protein
MVSLGRNWKDVATEWSRFLVLEFVIPWGVFMLIIFILAFATESCP